MDTNKKIIFNFTFLIFFSSTFSCIERDGFKLIPERKHQSSFFFEQQKDRCYANFVIKVSKMETNKKKKTETRKFFITDSLFSIFR